MIDLTSIVLPDVLEPVLGGLAAASGGGDDRWMRLLGRLHPLVVHFPIGLAITAAVVELVNIIRRRRDASPFAFTATGIAAGTAIIAAFFGWLNADYEGATQGTTLFLHRWLGIIAAGGLSIVFLAGIAGRSGIRITAFNGYRWGLLVCAIVLAVGSHFGGEMVYGKGYLTKVIFASSDKPAVPATGAEPAVPASGDETAAPVGTDAPAAEADASGNGDSTSVADASTVDFRRDVLPILDARCVECHGPDKVKGDLRLDSEAAIFAGDPEWWTVLWGDPDHSLLLERILLPADDPDAMPPNGDRLTAANIDTIRTWIESGGGGGKADVDASATIPPPAASVPDVGDAAAISTAADGLRQRGVLAMRIAQNSEDWEVNASLVSPPFTDDDFKLLKGLETVLVQASFNRSQITDAGLDGLAGFDRLNALRLAQTEIGDGAVDALLRLEGLEILNLYGTRISDAGLSRLLTLPNLKRVYCADSAVTPEGVVAAMKNARSGLDVIGPDAVSAAAVSDAEAADGESASP
ncbi:MAG: hypothetical protein CMJ27_06380 [Phycisphaerae bacterium]|nr:hypothetical protein [Phycisphaerae bacterium]MAH66002.1 hypothetical protein [Phycisphaerae bacterium]OUX01616.1 MAG: hypothetical protein CBD91_04185 [Phycisphaeraceae bacterium TMED231]OUX02662.1 MAG: hypothetical protein CBD91_01960 [Phycisphaeraceae bacterium TMED231]